MMQFVVTDFANKLAPKDGNRGLNKKLSYKTTTAWLRYKDKGQSFLELIQNCINFLSH